MKEIGIIEGVALLIGLAAEIPSGIIADKFGRRNTLILGNLMLLISSGMILYANAFWTFFVAQVIMWIGFAFVSGAGEALTYDSLKVEKQEKHYDSVISRTNSISTFMLIFSVFVGGLLFGINSKLPYLAWMSFSFICLVILLFIKEPKGHSHPVDDSYLLHLKDGSKILFSNKLSKLIWPILLTTALTFLYQGVVRQKLGEYFGYDGETFGYMLSFILLPTILISFKFDKIKEKFGEKNVFVFSNVLYIIAFSIAIFLNNLIAGLIVFFLIFTAEKLFKPLSSVIVNENIESTNRATALSTLTFIAQIPYVILLIFFIGFIEVGNLNILMTVFILILLLSTSLVFWAFKKK